METAYVGISEGQGIDGEGESTRREIEKGDKRELGMVMKRNDVRRIKWCEKKGKKERRWINCVDLYLVNLYLHQYLGLKPKRVWPKKGVA